MDDLISEFIGETMESLSALGRDTSDADFLPTLYRFAHTTKSTCGFLGLKRLESLAEACELISAKLRDGSLAMDTEIATLLNTALDRICTLVEHLANNSEEPTGDDSDLITQFTAFALKQRKPAAPKPAAKISTDIVLGNALPTVETVPTAETPATKPAPLPAAQDITHETLDHWMNMVGALVETRNQLQHAFAKNPDKKIQAPLKQLTAITSDLQESVHKARTAARVNSPQLAMPTVLVIEAANRIFALPQHSITEIIHLTVGSDATIETTGDTATLTTRSRSLPILRLSDMLELTTPTPITQATTKGYAIALRGESAEVALLVDTIADTAQVVLRPISRALGVIGIYAGMALLGDETIALILEAESIIVRFGDRKQTLQRLVNLPSETTQFLLFKAGAGAPKAIPLADVMRLATVDVANQEFVLRSLPGHEIPRAGDCDIIVCGSDKKSIGLVVDHIIDIVTAPIPLRAERTSHYLGSTLIAGAITDVVDSSYLLQNAAAGADA